MLRIRLLNSGGRWRRNKRTEIVNKITRGVDQTTEIRSPNKRD
uniref:Uncharacterized protein n=1 Tax=Arundo donax TaxID=35708 RepID=A0A0A9H2X4_ARUDO